MNDLPSVDTTRAAIDALLGAIEARDRRAIGRALSPDVRWQNVPHAPTEGHRAVVSMLGDIVTWSDEVRWDIVSASYGAGVGRLERVDRFCVDGRWLDAKCNGIFTVDASGRVSDVRDYVDLGEWRARAAPALDTMRSRTGVEVVRRHLDAVQVGDPVSMAADYAIDAVLIRGATSHDGWEAIADYFDTVPNRLAGRSVEFQDPTATATAEVLVRWQIKGDGVAASGRDTFVVRAGRIVRQTVELDTGDF